MIPFILNWLVELINNVNFMVEFLILDCLRDSDFTIYILNNINKEVSLLLNNFQNCLNYHKIHYCYSKVKCPY